MEKMYKDKPSKIVPYDPNEDWEDRHLRRKEVNLFYVDEVREFCRKSGISFQMTCDDYYWIFRIGWRTIEWWPASARMVFNRRDDRSRHVYDYESVISILGGFFRVQIEKFEKNRKRRRR